MYALQHQLVVVNDHHFRPIAARLVLLLDVFLMNQRQGYLYRKGTAHVLLARQFYLAAHHVHEVLHDGESQSETVLGGGITQLLEGFEDVPLLILFHSRSSVMDGQEHHAVNIVDMECHRTDICKLQGVGQQVAAYPQHLLLVTQHNLV